STSKTPSYTKSVSWQHHPLPVSAAMKTFPQMFYLCNIATQSEYSLILLFMSGPHNLSDHPG
ncbi:TPA: hypothetical protein ACOSR7_004543, partial [Escherichia coli]